MRRLFLVLSGVLAVVLVSGCAGRQVKPVGQTLTVFLSRAEPATLAGLAAAVREARQTGPVVWVVPVDAFEPGPATYLTDGESAVRLLNSAGVDAVLLTPEWLEFGPARLGQLVDMARFYLLSANVLDSTGQPLAHQFMVRRQGDVDVGLAGLWLVSLGRGAQAGGVRLAEPRLAAARVEALMRQRAGVVGVVVGGSDSAPAWGFDFVVGASGSAAVRLVLTGAVARYDLQINDGVIVSARPLRVDLERMNPDSMVKAVCDSIDREVEAVGAMTVTKQRSRASADELARRLVSGFLATREAEVWLSDGPLFRAGWDGAGIVRRDLVTLLFEPQRPVLFELSGAELKLLARQQGLRLAFGSGITVGRLADSRSYRVAATAGLLDRHPQLQVRGLARAVQPLWTIAADVLESAAAVR